MDTSEHERYLGKLEHGGWNPWTDEPPAEAVKRGLEFMSDVARRQGGALVIVEPAKELPESIAGASH